MSGNIAAELDEVLQAWGRAIIANDAEAIGRFAHEDWVLVGATGIFTREQFLAAVESGALTHATFETDVVRAMRYGDTAVATAHVTNTGEWNGDAFTSDEWATDVFLWRDGWQCVLTQLTPRSET